VFAPTDDAFDAKFPDGFDNLTKEEVAAVLKYHIIDGRIKAGDLQETQTVATKETPKELTITKAGDVVTVGINSATVTIANVGAWNGVVHIVDKVLDADDIVDKAIATPILSKLVDAVKKAELVDFLKGAGPYTVFAPTDDAFNAEFPNGFDSLTKEQVAAVLKYHVIDGRIKAGDLEDTQTVPTQEDGKELTITKAGDVVTVGANDATVTTADVLVVNGVVHIVNKVVKDTRFLTMI